jgi:hypothetical protein
VAGGEPLLTGPIAWHFWVVASRRTQAGAVTKGSGAGTAGERQFFFSCVGRIPAPCPHAARHSPGRLVQPGRGFSVQSPPSNAQPLAHRTHRCLSGTRLERSDACSKRMRQSRRSAPRPGRAGLASMQARSWFYVRYAAEQPPTRMANSEGQARRMVQRRQGGPAGTLPIGRASARKRGRLAARGRCVRGRSLRRPPLKGRENAVSDHP